MEMQRSLLTASILQNLSHSKYPYIYKTTHAIMSIILSVQTWSPTEGIMPPLDIRLLSSFSDLAKKMESSYEKLGACMTELKLDHREGAAPSDRLTALLGFCGY